MSTINGNRLVSTLKELGSKGIDKEGRRSRVAASDEDKAGRDYVVSLMEDIGLRVEVDRIGNIFGIWEDEENKDEKVLMIGSHIDSVVDAGIYDGCYGVLSGIEVVRTLKELNYKPGRPIVIGAFTNEEGIRYQPDMMGSLVYAGGLDINEALSTIGIDGTVLGDELNRIGYAGDRGTRIY
ncbi:M20/M25/M40 family metallo-hydrolase [Anaerosphaera multitolerans]|uniref:M20/M25/M40 family metallo-hydrolase n=1 Tax=Anaerosphaera multitolerans TaxID=2487351 RepID=UPI00196B8469|nr:M20/M25/M40 family metallo-hydrolase [Anaerosphaera multitolerans]